LFVVRHVGTAQLEALDTLVSTRSTRQTCRVLSRRDEPSEIWAYEYLRYYDEHLIRCKNVTVILTVTITIDIMDMISPLHQNRKGHCFRCNSYFRVTRPEQVFYNLHSCAPVIK